MNINIIWLVVSTPLKNIRQVGVFFPIYGKIQIMFQTTNQLLNTGILMNLELLGIIFSDTSKVPAARAARARQSPDPPTALPESAERRRPGRLRKATTTGRMGGRRLPIWGLYND